MFDWGAQEGIGDAGERSSGIVLAIAECRTGVLVEVCLLKLSTSVVEGAKLDRHTCADANEWCEGAFVECKWAFIFEDLARTVEGGGVLGCCLESDLDNIYSVLGDVVRCSWLVFGRYTKWLT